ncbi:MAG TPA: DUF3696 domain-containing protein [Acidiferrobacterales bacterium]|nr:DUF3696 domain-containing protein [Acidiferrobacterales bacterium]
MLIFLRLRNFKGFAQLELPLRPVTLLAGLNSSGKSSVIQAILLMQQIELDPIDPKRVTLNLQGSHVSLGTGRDVLHEFAEDDELEISFGLQNSAARQWVFAYDPSSDRLTAPAPEFESVPFMAQLTDVHYLCAERWGPRVIYPLSKSEAERGVGASGELAFHYLLLHRDAPIADPEMGHPRAKSHGLLGQVQAWLGEISPGTRIDIKEVPEADLAIPKFGFEQSGDVPSSFYRPTNVGFGLSYSLPIIAVLLSAKPGSIVLLENPEAHLHPRGQTQIAKLIAQASKRLQIIVETHSDHIMNGLRVAVKQGDIRAESVLFHYFEREGAVAKVKSMILDSNGRVDSWPEGFFDEYEQMLAALVAKK